VINDAKVIAARNPTVAVYNFLALSHKRLGTPQKSIEIYENILSHLPDNTLALSNLGNTLLEIGQINRGMELLKRSLAIDANQVGAMMSLAGAFVTTLNYDSALTIYQTLIAREGLSEEVSLDDIYFRIADIYRKKGPDSFDDAIHFYSKSGSVMSKSLLLECVYKAKSRSEYRGISARLNSEKICSPLMASIQNHAAIRYGMKDENNFCRYPFRFIKRYSILEEKKFINRKRKKL
jgi:tetratricopeptide (TPR) repeat protein